MLLPHALRAVQKTTAVQNLYSWGFNLYGTFGNNDAAIKFAPVQVGTDTNWSTVAKKYNHTMAVKTDGTLWAWGANTNGQLGLNDTIDRSSPVQVGSDTNWTEVDVGENFSIARKTNGTIWSCGLATNGRLGNGSTTVNLSSMTQIGTASSWTQISCGQDFVLAIANTLLYAWGANTYGQYGNNTRTQSTTPLNVSTAGHKLISAGYQFQVGVRSGATSALFNCGYGGNGELGITSSINFRSSPVQVGNTLDYISISAGNTNSQAAVNPSAASQPGALFTWGNLNRTAVTVISGTSGFTYVDSGFSVNFSRKTDGSVWAWGSNNYGNAGNGTTGGIGSSLGSAISPVPQLSNMTVIASGWNSPAATYPYGANSLGVKSDGTLWAWGYDYNGELGLNTNQNYYKANSPILASDSGDWEAVYSTGYTSISSQSFYALKTDGTLWAWGSNASGQLGLNNTSFYSSPAQVGGSWLNAKISVGPSAAMAVKSDGTLWILGGSRAFGANAATLTSSPIQVGALSSWSQVGIGARHMLATRTNGTLWFAGNSDSGQGAYYSVTLTFSSPTQIGALTTWTSPVVGGDVSGCLRTNGNLWMWGAGGDGVLGTNTVINRSSPVQVGALAYSKAVTNGTNTYGITTAGALYAWGWGGNGAIGNNATASRSAPIQIGTDTDWSDVSAGYAYCLAQKTTGTLWAWGLNTNGQLGLGTYTNVSSPVQIGSSTSWVESNGSSSSSSGVLLE